MKVLFLDDDHRRTSTFRDALSRIKCDLITVETAEECIAALTGRTFDLVLLDHDLGGEIYCDSSREDCGMEVVRWIRGNPAPHGAFIVHTMNPVAAATMYFELGAMGYRVAQAPFGSEGFYESLGEFLGRKPSRSRRRRRTLAERVGDYFRSIRFRR